MKQLLHVLVIVLLGTVVIAKEVQYSAKDTKSAIKKAVEKRIDDNAYVQSQGNIVRTSSRAALPGVKIGETAYNYQTNDNMKDRISWDPTYKTIHAEWMYGDIAEVPLFANRRMYYNYFDGSSWIHGKGIPIENADRAGYGALATDPNYIAVPVSHYTGDRAINAWYDFSPGFGFFTQSQIYLGDDEVSPMWPDIAIDDQDVWHVSAVQDNQDGGGSLRINNVNDNIVYFRSTNRGQTWSSWHAMFPDTSTYPLHSGPSGTNEAGGHQIAVADDGSGKVGILIDNSGHDLYLFESDDRGQTWKDAITIIGNPFFVPYDSLSYPFLWDIIYYDSTEVGGPVDTLITLFLYDTEGDVKVGRNNIDRRPHGPADLIYIDGEPHVVWNEMFEFGDNDGSYYYYPNGVGYEFTSPYSHMLNGDSGHHNGGFSIKHWSPSTGVSIIHAYYEGTDVYPGTFQQFLTMPQLGKTLDGTFYCLFTKYSESDTLLEEDGVTQADTDGGPLSFGRIWGAKSNDGGKTWNDAAQLIPEEECIHQNIRYIAMADINPNNQIHILYQNTPDIPGVNIGENPDHNSNPNADMYYWAIPTSLFPNTKGSKTGPDIKLKTSSKMGGLDFGDIGEAGKASATITVMNIGDENLTVTNAFTSDKKAFMVDPANFTVAPGGSQEVTITFQPQVEDLYFEFLALPNNDPQEHSTGIPLEGKGIPQETVVNNEISQVPQHYELLQNYPNPFNPATTIEFSLVQNDKVKLSVYNTLGKEIAVLVNGEKSAGKHKIDWKPTNLSSGVYFYRLTTENFTSTKKLVFMQ